ncbi:hypothetical protein RXV95_05440 [Novosphingobium sp. ZN18A2]|uniref:hypothetical protein n=1 Tax=Novosphingobium sp. ZN18A2 TaxID=3079861 RepID=UPI0030CC7443
MDEESVVSKVAELTAWWISQRTAKIEQIEHGSMEVNPFLAPLICALHGLDDARELANFVTAGHFYIGHGTGFGKLIDEKILPRAFGTEKLDKAFRLRNDLTDPAFDDIDHIVRKPEGIYLLSQKASKWTIQLGQAMGLNRSFKSLLNMRDRGEIDFQKIIVGVFYGHGDDLTDKYRILRGVTTGAAHDVVDISEHVEVLSGRSFWAWLAGDAKAQEWVVKGIFRAIREAASDEGRAEKATNEADGEMTGMLSNIGDINDEDDWIKFINMVNR